MLMLQAVENSSKTLLQTMNTPEPSLMVLAYEAERALMEDPSAATKIYFAREFENPSRNQYLLQ